MSKKDFNFNSNVDLFDKLEEIKKLEKSLYLEAGDKIPGNPYRGVNGENRGFENLIEKKYNEFLMGSIKPYTAQDLETVEKKVFEYKVKKSRTEDRLDFAEKTLSETMDKRNLDFSLPIVKNKKLKRAARRFFGERKKEITFDDYKKALKRLKELQKQEGKGLMEKKED